MGPPPALADGPLQAVHCSQLALNQGLQKLHVLHARALQRSALPSL